MAQQKIHFARPEYALCRTLMHPWEPSHIEVEGTKQILLLTCSRCSATKCQTIDRHGYLRRTQWRRPKDYKIEGWGKGGPKRSQIRLAMLEMLAKEQRGQKKVAALKKRAAVKKVKTRRAA